MQQHTRNKSSLVLSLLLLAAPALAVDTPLQVTEKNRSQQQMAEQVESARKGAEWTLSDKEWQRYESLMEGRRGIQSPGLDPLTALGIEAQSSAERREYAEKYVRQEFQRAERELAFQREVDAAWKRLYANVLPIGAMAGESSGVMNDSNGRLAIFVRQDCNACDARIAKLLASKRPFDIYLVGSEGKDEVVRAWARAHKLPVDRIKAREITLNHDGGKWLQYGNGLMPVVLQQGENGWTIAAF